MLIAGCVTSLYYINEFLALYLPVYDFSLQGEFHRKPGTGKTGVFRLEGKEVSLPVFFCSCSPSSRSPELLVRRVQENRLPLMDHLNATTPRG